MGLIPRRHRSLIYKLLLFVPALWLTVAFIIYSDRGVADPVDKQGGSGGGSAVGRGGLENELTPAPVASALNNKQRREDSVIGEEGESDK